MNKVNIFNTMDFDFKDDVVQSIEPFAKGIEQTCVKILKSRILLKQSICLIQEIIKYRPSSMKNEQQKQLWNAVDQSCDQIMNSTIQMMKVSSQFFGFFLKFQSSFNVFIAAVTLNPDISFQTSLAELKKDLKDFQSFQKQYYTSVQMLTENAFESLSKVVKNMIGYKEFETIQENEKKYWNEYLTELDNFRTMEKNFMMNWMKKTKN